MNIPVWASAGIFVGGTNFLGEQMLECWQNVSIVTQNDSILTKCQPNDQIQEEQCSLRPLRTPISYIRYNTWRRTQRCDSCKLYELSLPFSRGNFVLIPCPNTITNTVLHEILRGILEGYILINAVRSGLSSTKWNIVDSENLKFW